MRTITTTAEASCLAREKTRQLVCVPTMGALHAGHAALIGAARARAGDGGRVVVTIFVNPTQFGPNEDFSKYPRTLDADLEVCRQNGADAVFAPSQGEIYLPGDSTIVEETRLSQGLCGTGRPGHFRGVCTVVAKLFQILRPDAAIFGEKDYQQLVIIRRMARDLFFPVEIIGHPIVREQDGLALSSRNRYLSLDERQRAAALPAALRKARDLAAAGETRGAEIVRTVRDAIAGGTGAEPEYIELVDAGDLQPLVSLSRAAVLAAAVRIGETRLIDNVHLSPPHGKV